MIQSFLYLRITVFGLSFVFQRCEIQKSSDTKTQSDTDRQGAHLEEERWMDCLCGVCGEEEEEGDAEELNC